MISQQFVRFHNLISQFNCVSSWNKKNVLNKNDLQAITSLYFEAFIAEIRRKAKLAKAYYHSDIGLSLDFKFKISSFIAVIQKGFLHKKVSHSFPFISSPPPSE